MSTIMSKKKIEVLNGVTDATLKFMNETSENLPLFTAATGVVGVPLLDNIHNGIVAGLKEFDIFAETLSDKMKGMALSYSERSGFGPEAKAAFEDCATYVTRIRAGITSKSAVEISNGLEENVTEETIGAYTKAMLSVLAPKDVYIHGVSAIVQDNMEKDTQEIYQSIGSGIEKLTNRFAILFQENADELKKFGINLDEVNAQIKSAATEVAATGVEAAGKVSNPEAGLV